MSEEVIIIVPELREGAGGLADYTLRLTEQWRTVAPVRFLVPSSADFSTGAGQSVEEIGRSAEELREKLPARGGKVLLQYSAYGFDSHGYPRWLLRTLTDWKERAAGLLVVMFHEIWGLWPLLNTNYLLQRLHRRAIKHLVRQADTIFTSTPSQAEHLRALRPASPVQVLPVGSNIRVQSSSPVPEGKRGSAVLFGLQASRLRTLRHLGPELKALAAAGQITRIVTLGGRSTSRSENEERALLANCGFKAEFEQRGVLPEAEISSALSAATFGISAQPELSLMKSGTFMAYAAHGLNILSPFADPLASEPLCWLTSPAELRNGISEDQLNARAESLRAWQERTSSWLRIADEFARALGLRGATSA